MIKNCAILLLLIFSFTNVYNQSIDYFIEHGLQNSPLLKDFQGQISAASIDSIMIKSAHRPQIDANAQILYSPAYKNFGYDEAITNGGNYSSVVSISQFFLNKKTISNKYENINLQKQSLDNTLKISSNDLKRLITNQYLQAFADFSNFNFSQLFLKLMYEQKDFLKQFVEHGLYKQTDYLSFLIETQNQEMLAKQIKSQYVKDIYLLNQLCGLNDTVSHELTLPAIKKNTQANIYKSPLFSHFYIDSLKIINDNKSIGLRYRPKFNWFADAGFLSSSPNSFYKYFGYSAGINFNIPIYDGHQRVQEYQKLKISENTRENYSVFFKNQFSQQMQQLNEDLKTTREMQAQLKIQLNSANELVNMEKALLNTGNVSITELINAMKNYININLSLNQLQIKELQIINEWNYLMQQ